MILAHHRVHDDMNGRRLGDWNRLAMAIIARLPLYVGIALTKRYWCAAPSSTGSEEDLPMITTGNR